MKKSTNLLWVLLAVASVAGSPAQAITIRTDRSDSQYQALANSSYKYGGMIIGNGWFGSGTLISPNWVLTAGHCLSGSVQFQNAAGTYNVTQQILYPGLDIGLAKLSSPVNSMAPVKLYSMKYGVEQGREAVILGVGYAGTGISGEIGGTGGTRRAAQTYVLCNADDWGWGSSNLITYFRDPSSGADLEGNCVHGDSGGALILNVNGQNTLAGVMSQWWNYNGCAIGIYGTGGVYVRSAPLNDWIKQYATDATIVPEPTTTASILVGTGMLLVTLRRQKRR